jgi:hypothetical protein
MGCPVGVITRRVHCDPQGLGELRVIYRMVQKINSSVLVIPARKLESLKNHLPLVEIAIDRSVDDHLMDRWHGARVGLATSLKNQSGRHQNFLAGWLSGFLSGYLSGFLSGARCRSQKGSNRQMEKI